MTDRYPTALLVVCTPALLLALVAAAVAQTPPAAAETEPPAPPPAEAPKPLPKGFRGDYLLELARLEERTLALAREVPAERWTERSGPEVHSLDECLAGIGAASRRILTGMEREAPPAPEDRGKPAAAGGEVGAGEQDDEQEDDKTRRLEELAAVFAAVRRAVEETPDDGLELPIDLLGRRWTVRALFLALLGQSREALGPAAAHAEVLGVPPPWIKQRRASEASID